MRIALKTFFSKPATGVVFALLALFLIVDTFYLNRIKDQQAETLNTAQQALESYQENLQTDRSVGNLKPYAQRFHYGGFLTMAMNAFKEAHSTLQITEIHVEETPQTTQATLTFPHRASKKKKTPLETRLTLRGQIQGALPTEAPYQQLNEILSTISQETGCTLQLFKGTEALPTGTLPATSLVHDHSLPFQFELQLVPKHQKQCWQRYIQPTEAS